MTKKKFFYVTTPIYYPNDIPHIGHAYTTIAADILCRWHNLQGNEVFFLTGTDEHGKKIEQTALKNGKKPQEFVDNLIPKFKDAWNKLSIDYNRFIRTTDKDHEKVVKKLLEIVYEKGDIYLGEYEGYYCTGCEAYYLEKDLEEGNCPVHKKPIELLKEQSYFFKLSKYQKKLLEFYKKNPDFLSPEFRSKEIINRVKEGLQDLSISRTSFSWGIEVPFDKKHITYVWFDALTNYISGVGYLTDKSLFKKFWPADVHLIGKDIFWFHAVIWPAMLFSAGIKPPKKVFAHGWWTFDKEKISKSRGKVINIDELINIAGVDSARYFLFRETPFGEDGDFSEDALIKRNNTELADKYGNLVSRISSLIEKYGMKKTDNTLLKKFKIKEVEKNINVYAFDKVLFEIFSFIDVCNEYVQKKELWKSGDQKALYELADSIKIITILLWPFIPSTAEKVAKQFSFKIGKNSFKEIKKPLKISKIKKGEILFKKIEIKEVEKEIIKTSNTFKIEGLIKMNEIEFSEWQKIDLRVGTIIHIESIEGADKLYKLTVDIGEKKIIICAGLKKFYTEEQLQGKQCIVFVNLKPRMMKGIESQGMLLAAVNDEESSVILLSPEKKIENGSKIR